MEEYLRSLQKQLKSFPPDEQAALMEEIRSHIESGESDPRMGSDEGQRRDKVMKELGTPSDMGQAFSETYRPGRIIDYALILIPFLLYPYLNSFYANVIMPRYAGGALLLDVIIHLPLMAIGLWRKSASLTLFWAAILISQVSYICGRLYWYYGWQTVLWALLLLGLLYIAGRVVWENRSDPLTVAFGLVMIGMSSIGSLLNALSGIGSFGLLLWRSRWIAGMGGYGFLDRSLLEGYITIRDMAEFYSVLVLALFFIPSNRAVRWLAIAVTGLIMGLGHRFLLEDQNLMASWIYVSWVLLPLAIVAFGWWVERTKANQLRTAI